MKEGFLQRQVLSDPAHDMDYSLNKPSPKITKRDDKPWPYILPCNSSYVHC